jgi:hypothetical protein
MIYTIKYKIWSRARISRRRRLRPAQCGVSTRNRHRSVAFFSSNSSVRLIELPSAYVFPRRRRRKHNKSA